MSYILNTQGQLTAGQVLPKIKLIKAFIVVLDTCKNDEDACRNESIRVLTTLLPLKVYGDFSDIQGQLTP